MDTAALGRLTWRCRRGMKELDLVLQHWLRLHLPQASPAERSAFEALLDWPDPRLAACLLGDDPVPAAAVTPLTPADPALACVLAQLRAGTGRPRPG